MRMPQQPQSQVGSFFPFSAAIICAVAHPVPDSTLIALTGQLSAHAPHSMQAVGRISSAMPLF